MAPKHTTAIGVTKEGSGPSILRDIVRRVQLGASGPVRGSCSLRIGIVKSASTLAVCYSHLDEIAAIAAQAVASDDCVAFTIPTSGPCDGLFFANGEGARLTGAIDRMASDIEMMVRGAALDGVLFLSSCDTTTPAHLVAAARLDIPAVFLPCGYQSAGSLKGRRVDLLDVYEAVGAVAMGDSSMQDLEQMADHAVTGPGVCPGLGTATTMHMVTEALGMALLGSAPIAGSSPRLRNLARAAALATVKAARVGITPRGLLSSEAIADAVKFILAVGGAPSSVVFLQLLADELGLPLNIRGLVAELGSTISQLCFIAPCGINPVDMLERAGGAAQVLKRLGSHLNLDRSTIAGTTMRDALAAISRQDDAGIFADRDCAPDGEPGLVVAFGNLAPKGAIVRPGTVPPAIRSFAGPAQIFADATGAFEALARGDIKPGNVLVIRGSGIDDFACAISGTQLSDKVALVSDGGFSGLSRGLCLGYVRPSFAENGPIANLKDGDEIAIDLAARRLNVTSWSRAS
jgi:dihydroxy-acid dehydratase